MLSQNLPSNIKILEEIGRGSTGSVFKAVDVDLKKNIVLKIFKQNVDEGMIREEISVNQKLSMIHNDDFLKFNGVFTYNNNMKNRKYIALAMEYAVGNLNKFLKLRKFYSEEEIIFILKHILKGLIEASKNGIFHCDIKAANIVVLRDNNNKNEKFTYKLCDFGGSIQIEKSKEKKFNYMVEFKMLKSFTQNYASPEIKALYNIQNYQLINENSLKNPLFDITKIDVYSLGVLILKMRGLSFLQIKRIKKFCQNDSGNFLEKISNLNLPKLSTIIKKMLIKDPNKRISLFQLYKKFEKLGEGIQPNEALYADEIEENIKCEYFENLTLEEKFSYLGRKMKIFAQMKQFDDCYSIIKKANFLLSQTMQTKEKEGNFENENFLWREWEAAIEYQKKNLDKALDIYLELLKEKNYVELRKASIFSMLSKIYEEKGNLDLSLSTLSEALNITENNYGKNHIKTIKLQEKEAIILFKMCSYERSADIVNEIIKLDEEFKILEENNKNSTTTYRNFGLIFKKVKNLSSSKKYFEKSLEIIKNSKISDSNEKEIALIYFNLAEIYYHNDNLEIAIEFCQISLNIYEKLELKKEIAQCCSIMGDCQKKLKKYDLAGKNYQIAYQNYNEIYGENNENSSSILIGLAVVNKEMGKYDDAIKNYNHIINFFEHSSKENKEIDIANALNNISIIYQKRKEYGQSLANLEKALNIYQSKNDKKNIELCIFNIGVLYQELQSPMAIENFQKALNLNNEIYGEINENSLLCLDKLIKIYKDNVPKNLNKALEYAEKCLNVCLTLYKEEHLKTRYYYSLIGSIYIQMNEIHNAKKFLTKSLQIIKQLETQPDKDTLATYRFMASIEKQQKNFKKSMEYYEKAKEVSIQIYGKNHQRTTEIIQKINHLKPLI